MNQAGGLRKSGLANLLQGGRIAVAVHNLYAHTRWAGENLNSETVCVEYVAKEH